MRRVTRVCLGGRRAGRTVSCSKQNVNISWGARTVYHQRVVDHVENARNVGSMDVNNPNVGTGLVGAPACGDVMKLQVQINPETGVIEKAVFRTFGCGSAIASSSLVTEMIQGMPKDSAKEIKNKDIAKYLSLPPVKLHCSMLAEDAVKAAVRDWERKQIEPQVRTALFLISGSRFFANN
eukprot:TRINITY_DN1231_c0_g1_i1.p1 TRINITY_DN1231_c0_g1~~TRINITY_DN1231_c0_g1_i1.p1  ORF type:complete len:180 (+),score=56.39 TRINITY_DN1231_c0_g1_i1:82-621(+)